MADVYGQLLGRQGATFTILSLVVTSDTRPLIGNKARLFARADGSSDEAEWVLIADAEVKAPLDAGGKMQIKLTSDEKKLGGANGKKLAPLVKGARLKVTWEW